MYSAAHGSKHHTHCGRHPDVFEDELGTLKGFTAKLKVDPKPKPILCIYSLNYLRSWLKSWIDGIRCNAKNGLPSQQRFSNTDQSLCPCEDYNIVIRCSNLGPYPTPRIDYLYVKLRQGEMFIKLDLRFASLQVSLDENTKQCLNTPRCLYRFSRLSYDVKSPPDIYQQFG